jgi:zinc/manganese transport system substrate-binding protein
LLGAGPVGADGPLPIVATFSILGDLTAAVGGDRVSVTTLVGPGGDAHVYNPTPGDARRLGEARVFIANGLGFEGWMARLAEAAGYEGPVIIATTGIEPRVTEDGDIDPHAWQDPANGVRYIENIRDGLIAADPAGADVYRARAADYLDELRTLSGRMGDALAAIPSERRLVVTSHDAFGYLGAAFDIAFVAPTGVSTEAEASAADVASLIRQIRAHAIPAVFVENISDPRLLQQIRRETGVRLGGTLYSDALSPADGPASTYLRMLAHNTDTIAAALAAPVVAGDGGDRGDAGGQP